MLFQRVNRNEPEKIFISVTNVQGATITTGLPVSLSPAAASFDGVNAVKADAAGDYPGFVGIAKEDIANNDVGLVQVYGYVNSIYLSNAGTSITITALDPIVPAPAGFFSAAPSYANSGLKTVLIAETATVSAASYVKGLIKAL